jgi:hypothetical protein
MKVRNQPTLRLQLRHFRCKEFYPLVLWIWNQNIAISTIVGTSSHNMIIGVTYLERSPINFFIGLRPKLGNAYFHIMGSPNYDRNSNILIPDPYH